VEHVLVTCASWTPGTEQSVISRVILAPTVVSGRLNVVKGLKRTNQIASFGRSRHMIVVGGPSQDLFGQRPW
jgi:hypothetical protein